MLTVDIKINGREISRMELVRQNDVFVSEVLTEKDIPCEYKVKYIRSGEKDILFKIKHNYQDMAEILVAKAMRKARRLLNKS